MDNKISVNSIHSLSPSFGEYVIYTRRISDFSLKSRKKQDFSEIIRIFYIYSPKSYDILEILTNFYLYSPKYNLKLN